MIVCIGESLIDMVAGKPCVGGCQLNVAMATSRLGASVALFSKISSDSYGKLILETLIDNCVMFDPPLCNSELPTLIGHAVVDDNGVASYKFDWEKTASVSFTRQELESAFSVMTDIDFVMTGSLATVLPPGCDEIFPAISTITPKPVVLYDPNVRPAVIANFNTFRKKMMGYIAKCDIVKVSEEDLLLTRCVVADLVSYCKDLNIHIIITRGENGSSWISPSFAVDVPSYKVNEVVDTIGCGDVFTGAVLMQLQKMKDEKVEAVASGICANDVSARDVLDALSNDDAERILRFASKVAALNCTKKGCNPPSLEQLSL